MLDLLIICPPPTGSMRRRRGVYRSRFEASSVTSRWTCRRLNCPSLSASTIQHQGVRKDTKIAGEAAACCNDGTLRRDATRLWLRQKVALVSARRVPEVCSTKGGIMKKQVSFLPAC